MCGPTLQPLQSLQLRPYPQQRRSTDSATSLPCACRCREQGTSTTRVIVEAEEWVHFVRWRRTQQVVRLPLRFPGTIALTSVP